MPLPITIPNTFANATATIPLSQLDNNFSTVAVAVNSIGNGAFTLANAQITGGTISNVTLDNVSVDVETLSNVTITNLTVDGNANFSNATVEPGMVISGSSSGDALRITQEGAGNALVVEDSANPDSTPFVIDAGGKVVSGYTATQAFNYASVPRFQINGTSQSTSAATAFSASATAGVAPSVLLGRARGTQAAPTIVAVNDDIGLIQFEGYDGAGLIPTASILAEVDGTPGPNDMPGRLVFSTTADGASSPTERMRIDSDGRVGVGSVNLADAFSVSAVNFTGVAANALGARITFPETATTIQRTFLSVLSGADSGSPYTVSDVVIGMDTTNYTKGTNQTVTNQYGFRIGGLTAGDNNYGFYSNIASGTGRWNFYANGTADNVFVGNVGIKYATTPIAPLHIGLGEPGGEAIRLSWNSGTTTQAEASIGFGRTLTAVYPNAAISGQEIDVSDYRGNLLFYTRGTDTDVAPTERVRIDSSGNLLVGTTDADPAGSATNANGIAISAASYISMTRTSAAPLNVNRKSTDGDVVTIRQDGTTEGTISVSGTTVSYNAFAGSHWSQLQDGSKPEILRGTVMESIDELCQWPDEPTSERLCRSKISDTAGSKRVYGVFMDWDNDWTATNDMLVTSLGAFICRVNAGVTVQMGDLLESNGDGTARVQADDIIRSSTIGKVTSTIKTHEYDDGSYCVPTVLYCG